MFDFGLQLYDSGGLTRNLYDFQIRVALFTHIFVDELNVTLFARLRLPLWLWKSVGADIGLDLFNVWWAERSLHQLFLWGLGLGYNLNTVRVITVDNWVSSLTLQVVVGALDLMTLIATGSWATAESLMLMLLLLCSGYVAGFAS